MSRWIRIQYWIRKYSFTFPVKRMISDRKAHTVLHNQFQCCLLHLQCNWISTFSPESIACMFAAVTKFIRSINQLWGTISEDWNYNQPSRCRLVWRLLERRLEQKSKRLEAIQWCEPCNLLFLMYKREMVLLTTTGGWNALSSNERTIDHRTF